MRYRDFKHYYLFHLCRTLTSEFPTLVSYNRFVELSNIRLLVLVAFLRTRFPGKCTGISSLYFTTLIAYRIRHEHSHRVREGLTTTG